MLITLDELSQKYPDCRTWTLDSIVTALFVLSIYTWKHPSSWQARADLQLIGHATAYTIGHYQDLGMHSDFISLLSKLHEKVENKVNDPEGHSAAPTQPQTPEPGFLPENPLSDSIWNIPGAELWTNLFGPGLMTDTDAAFFNFDASSV